MTRVRGRSRAAAVISRPAIVHSGATVSTATFAKAKAEPQSATRTPSMSQCDNRWGKAIPGNGSCGSASYHTQCRGILRVPRNAIFRHRAVI